MNEHDYHAHVITVTLEENNQIASLVRAAMDSMAETRSMFDAVDRMALSARELQLIHATLRQLSAMEEVLRVLLPLFQRAECKPEVIQ